MSRVEAFYVKRNTTGEIMELKDIHEFSFFKLSNRLYLKLSQRDDDTTDVWDVDERRAETINPRISVIQVLTTGSRIEGLEPDCFDFGHFAEGELLKGKQFSVPGLMFKMTPKNSPTDLNAFDVKEKTFVHIEDNERVQHCFAEYTLVEAE